MYQDEDKLEPLTRPLNNLQYGADQEAYRSFANIAVEFRNLDSYFAIRKRLMPTLRPL